MNPSHNSRALHAVQSSILPFLLMVVIVLNCRTGFCEDRVKLAIRVVDADSGKPVTGYHAASKIWKQVAGHPDERLENEVTSDSQGRAAVDFAPATTNGYTRRLVVQHPDYVPWEVGWYWQPNAPQGLAQQNSFPTEFTVRLPKGSAIGGVVKDDAGKPLAGVRVYPIAEWGFRPSQPTERPAWPNTYYWDQRDTAPHAITDAEGRWVFPKYPQRFDQVRLTFVRPDNSFTSFRTSPPQSRFGVDPPMEIIPLHTLLRQTAEVTLKRGLSLRGEVVNAEGAPVPAAAIAEFHGTGVMAVSRFRTDSDGRFTLENRPWLQATLVVQAPGFALKPALVRMTETLPPLRIQLLRQKTLLARVVDESGKPISHAGVQLDQMLDGDGFGRAMVWEGVTTDLEGRFRWEIAPREPVPYSITGTNIPRRVVRLSPRDTESVIVIRKEQGEFIRLTGIVSAADDGAPVPQFTVKGAEGDGQKLKFEAACRNGKLDIKLPHAVWPRNFYPRSELQIVAEGFEPASLGKVNFYEGDQEFHVKLNRGRSGLPVEVLLPNGRPAAGATVAVARGSFGIFLNRPGELQSVGNGAIRLVCDADGRFTPPADPNGRRFVVLHSDGFAALPTHLLRTQAVVRLQPWGQVKGVAMEMGKPLVGESITLTTHPLSHPEQPFGLNYMTTSGEDGAFSFAKVPAGEMFLCRRARKPGPGPILYTHLQPVTAKAGEAVNVTYGGAGRTVIGWARSSAPGAAIDWERDVSFLTLKQDMPSEPRYDQFVRSEDYQTARSAFFASPEVRRNKLAQRLYALTFTSDGRFRVTAVQPGRYELTINLTEPSQERGPFPFDQGKVIGLARLEVTVPDGRADEPFDLGQVTVNLIASVPQGKTLPPFEALTLDGKPLRIADYRDKHVLVVFWAAWCRATAEALPGLRNAYDAFRGDSRVAMVGVSLDEKPAVAKAFAEKNDLPWATGWLDAAGQARAASVFGVKGTPTIFLFDRAGQVVARDLQVSNLKVTIQTALRGK